jgi:ferritin-like metal-binding protein YciE
LKPISRKRRARSHVSNRVFESLDEKVRGKHCDGIAGIIEEGASIMEEDVDETTMDACLIAAGQRAEHYEMAAYGTLVAWAQAMGHTEAAKLLQQTLEEEKAADKKLSGLAEGGINQGGAAAGSCGSTSIPLAWRSSSFSWSRGSATPSVALRNMPLTK